MRSLFNIEPSVFRPGTYVGFSASGTTYRIVTFGPNRRGSWVAYSNPSMGDKISPSFKTLQALSDWLYNN